MKSTFSSKIINTLVMGGLVLSLFIFGIRISQTSVDAQATTPGGGSPAGLLDASGGVLALFELWPKTSGVLGNNLPTLGQTASLIGQTTSPVVFRQYGTAILGEVFGFNDGYFNELFVGFSSIPSSGQGQFEMQGTQGIKLHVDGMIQIKGLADPEAANFAKLCTNDFGRLIRCATFGDSIPGDPGGGGDDDGGGDGGVKPPGDDDGKTPEPVNGVCGPAHGTNYIMPSTPPTSDLCTTGTASSVSSVSGVGFTWTCQGSDGGTTASCSATMSRR